MCNGPAIFNNFITLYLQSFLYSQNVIHHQLGEKNYSCFRKCVWQEKSSPGRPQFFFFFFYRFPGDIFFFSLVSFAFFVFFVFTCLSQKSLGKSSFHSSSANDSKFITYCLPFFLNHVFFVPSFIIFCFFYFSIYSILHILLQFTPIYTNMLLQHCVKGVRIRSYSSPYFPACGLNTERETPYLSVFSPNAGKCKPE